MCYELLVCANKANPGVEHHYELSRAQRNRSTRLLLLTQRTRLGSTLRHCLSRRSMAECAAGVLTGSGALGQGGEAECLCVALLGAQKGSGWREARCDW